MRSYTVLYGSSIGIPRSTGQVASLPSLISSFREKEPGYEATGQLGETNIQVRPVTVTACFVLLQ